MTQETTNSQTTNPYNWLIPKTTEGTRLDVLRELREAKESLPETKAVWKPAKKTNVDMAKDNSRVLHEMLLCLGCWRVPEWATNQNNAEYVNPDAIDARRYADVVGTCECGARVGREAGPYPEWETEHDGCSIVDRRKAEVELWKKRERAIRKMRLYRLKSSAIGTRLGVSSNHVTDIAWKLNMSMRDLESESKTYTGKIIRELRGRGFTCREIGEAFGWSKNTVSKMSRWD